MSEAAAGRTAISPRLSGIDRLRGLAIVLMVLDHSLATFGGNVVLRGTVTRASLPLFGLCAGALLCGRDVWRSGRLTKVAAAGVLATVVAAAGGLPIGQPDVLAVFVLAVAVVPVLRRWPVATLCVAILQPVTWPLWRGGYQLGTVVALVALGAHVGPARLDDMGRRLPCGQVLAWIGRRPLTCYLGHLTVLALVKAGI